jgi:CheY-like chemotaxis protein
MILPSRPAMLLIDDSDEDYESVIWALRRVAFDDRIVRCASGDEALELLYHRGRYADTAAGWLPSLIVLDLNLPGTDGRELLQQLKRDETLRSIPIVVYTTSSDPRDIEYCYQIGANSYQVKPVDFEKFCASWQSLVTHWFYHVTLPPTERQRRPRPAR